VEKTEEAGEERRGTARHGRSEGWWALDSEKSFVKRCMALGR
jgi:hypothetical protein